MYHGHCCCHVTPFLAWPSTLCKKVWCYVSNKKNQKSRTGWLRADGRRVRCCVTLRVAYSLELATPLSSASGCSRKFCVQFAEEVFLSCFGPSWKKKFLLDNASHDVFNLGWNCSGRLVQLAEMGPFSSSYWLRRGALPIQVHRPPTVSQVKVSNYANYVGNQGIFCLAKTLVL